MASRSSQAIFRAVADGTRRSILDLLNGSERSVNEIVARFRVSQPTISQHLEVLSEAGLVARRRDGRRILYRLKPGGLRRVYDWSAHYARFWPGRLEALGSLLDERRG
jgi:DNA-binding transcriptional ArsR family regulator